MQLKGNLKKNKRKTIQQPTKSKMASMRELSEREDIIITRAGRYGAAVIVDVKDYIKEADRQLNKN